MTTLGPLNIEYVPTDAVSTHPENARRGDVDAIAESIDTNGMYRPIVVQRSTGYILAGNHTYLAAVQHGDTEVPVTYLDVDDTAARRIMIADNRHADLGDYDDEALLDLLRGLPDLEGTGYDEDSLDALASALDHEHDYGDDLEGALEDADRAAWPIIRVQVEPSVAERFRDGLDGDTDEERFLHLLNRAGL